MMPFLSSSPDSMFLVIFHPLGRPKIKWAIIIRVKGFVDEALKVIKDRYGDVVCSIQRIRLRNGLPVPPTSIGLDLASRSIRTGGILNRN